MTADKLCLPWPGPNDRVVVKEMLRDHQSEHWYECYEFVKRRVQSQAKNLSRDRMDDVVQETMIRVEKYLPAFRYGCSLRTWIIGILRSCIIDEHRKLIHIINQASSLDNIQEDSEQDNDEHESEALVTMISQTAEDECMIHEELTRARLALESYISTHAHPKRNGQILDMVIFKNYSLEEAARIAGCSAPVAGYIVRSAQRYVREALRD